MFAEIQPGDLKIIGFIIGIFAAWIGMVWLIEYLARRERVKHELRQRAFVLRSMHHCPEAGWVMETQDHALFQEATPYEITYEDWDEKQQTVQCWVTKSKVYWLDEMDIERARFTTPAERRWDYVLAGLLIAASIWLLARGGLTLPMKRQRHLHLTGASLWMLALAAVCGAASLVIKVIARQNHNQPQRRLLLTVGDITGKSGWAFFSASLFLGDLQ